MDTELPDQSIVFITTIKLDTPMIIHRSMARRSGPGSELRLSHPEIVAYRRKDEQRYGVEYEDYA